MFQNIVSYFQCTVYFFIRSPQILRYHCLSLKHIIDQLAEAEDMITTDITMDKIEKFWDMLETSLAEKRAAVQAEKDR